MDINNKTIYFNGKNSKNDLKKYRKDQPKKKIDWISIILGVAAITFFVLSFIISYYLVFAVLAVLIVLYMKLYKTITKYKKIYLEYIEKCLKEEAKEKGTNTFSLSALYPIFITVSDEEENIKIEYHNEYILDAFFKNIKNYRLYTNKKKYAAKQRLPEMPQLGIMHYIMEINFVDDSSITFDFYNFNMRFFVYNKSFYQQLCNTNSINSLATIIDKILVINKKSK